MEFAIRLGLGIIIFQLFLVILLLMEIGDRVQETGGL